MVQITGASNDNELTGSRYADEIAGGHGHDTLYGREGNDRLSGGVGWVDHLWGGKGDDTYIIRDSLDVVHELANEGIDTVFSQVNYSLTANVENLVMQMGEVGNGNSLRNDITGNAENNTLDGGLGNDVLRGGGGTDTADFDSWDVVGNQAMVVEFDLTAEGGSATRRYVNDLSGTYAEMDLLSSIENIRGTNFNDLFRGTSIEYAYYTDNEFWGRGGNDTFQGDMGRDTYHGDSGIDTVDYTRSLSAITIDLRSGGTGGGADGDRYTGMERAIGSAYDDNITGTDDDNRLSGLAGDDNIFGGIGNDTLIGGLDSSIDRLSGGAGFDTFLYLTRDDSRSFSTRTGDAILDFNVNEDTIDLRQLSITAPLLIQNFVIEGANISRVTEDANSNGATDEGEFSIVVGTEGGGFISGLDILL